MKGVLEIIDTETSLKMIEESSSRNTEVEEAKFNLYSIYILNLQVYLSLDINERADHPVTSKLTKIRKLLEKLEQEDVMGVSVKHKEGTRNMTYKMRKNKKHNEKFERNNPRKKNRERAKKLMKKAEYKFDGNIDIHKSYSTKY